MSFRQFEGALESKSALVDRIKALKDRGASHITINSYLRCINAYFNWVHKEHGGERLRIPKLKEDQRVLVTFSPEQVATLLKPLPPTLKGLNNRRAQVLSVLLLDTGLRISEALGLQRGDVDLDSLTLRVMGKGGKERRVPISGVNPKTETES
jgi:site-specific recombinase XerD